MTALVKTYLVEGCPCEVVEGGVEYGVVCSDNSKMRIGDYGLVVAPDGTLFVAYWDSVSVHTPYRATMRRRLRQMAREMTP